MNTQNWIDELKHAGYEAEPLFKGIDSSTAIVVLDPVRGYSTGSYMIDGYNEVFLYSVDDVFKFIGDRS